MGSSDRRFWLKADYSASCHWCEYWLQPDYFACLARHGVIHVFNSWEAMPNVSEQMFLPGSHTNPHRAHDPAGHHGHRIFTHLGICPAPLPEPVKMLLKPYSFNKLLAMVNNVLHETGDDRSKIAPSPLLPSRVAANHISL
jgi:hypothetical protein